MRLEEIMTPNVRTIDADASSQEAATLMQVQRIHHLVVLSGRQIAGVLSERDLRNLDSADLRSRRVADLMSRDVVTAPPDTPLRRAANLLRGRWIGCLPIVEDGKLLGIVTLTDLLEFLGHGKARPSRRGERPILSRGRGPRRERWDAAGLRAGRR